MLATVTINGHTSESYGPYGYGESCTIAWQTLDIQPDDDKYYVKGIRLAGHDEPFASGHFPVEEDMQFVVAYGLKKGRSPIRSTMLMKTECRLPKATGSMAT